MNYLLGFPAKIQAVLEPIKLQADLKYRMTGHAHPIDARDAALRYFTHTYCHFEAGLWQAVEKGDLLYPDITPHLDRLRNKLVSDVFTRANLGRCREPGSMWGYLGTFSGLADQALEESSQWRAVVKKRSKLAKLATNPAPPVTSSSSAQTPPMAAADSASREVERGEETPAIRAAAADLIAPNEQELRKAAREQFVLPLLEEAGWTPTQWATESNVDPSVTLDYLAGKSTPRRPQRFRITERLRRALNRTTLRLPD